jgi:hypothetical protein
MIAAATSGFGEADAGEEGAHGVWLDVGAEAGEVRGDLPGLRWCEAAACDRVVVGEESGGRDAAATQQGTGRPRTSNSSRSWRRWARETAKQQQQQVAARGAWRSRADDEAAARGGTLGEATARTRRAGRRRGAGAPSVGGLRGPRGLTGGRDPGSGGCRWGRDGRSRGAGAS